MKRKDFLKGIGLIGLGTVALPIIGSCSNDDDNTTTPINNLSCDVSPTETAGPFPTHSPSSLVTNDIRSDRTGVDLTVNIHLKNANASHAALPNAIVDIWHCDKDGNYSEYSGFSSAHFLRGRQIADADGLVSFTTIFPGWYNGRATHIHVHIYNSSGASLLVTQIAFPEAANSAVVTVNASTADGYTKGMNGYTYNAADNVFADSATCELAEVNGSIAAGYLLESTINVSA